MQVSIILSTYNQPAWLELVLWGYASQSYKQFQIVVADDGSATDTRQVVTQMQRWTTLEVEHVWHSHAGFRKCTILNRAVQAASGDYVVFSDGDCIPRRDFVAQHVRLSEPRRFLSGGAIRLPSAVSEAILPEDVVAGRLADVTWLRRRGLPRSHRDLRLLQQPVLSQWLDAITPTRPTWNGGNSSAWKSDILKINGFDERMQHGGLDREFGERLEYSGIRGKQVRHQAICLHLEHSRAYATQPARQLNDAIRRQTRQTHATWTPHGIRKPGRPAA